MPIILFGSGMCALTLATVASAQTPEASDYTIRATMFGWKVLCVGDLDGDGQDDLAVSAPKAYTAAGRTGAVLILSGASGKLLHQIDGPPNLQNFGWELSLFAASPTNENPRLVISDKTFRLQDDGYVTRSAVFALTDWRVLASIENCNSAELRVAGDVDGDGFGDFLVVRGIRDEKGWRTEMGWHSGKTFAPLSLAPIVCSGRVLDEDYDGDGFKDLLTISPGAENDMELRSTRSGELISTIHCGHSNYHPFRSVITIPRLIDGKRGVLVDLSWPDDKRAHLATFSGISGVEIKQPSRVDAYAQPLFYTPFVASDIDGDGVGDVATLCDSQGFEGVRAWSSKSLEMIWAVRGIVLREATTFATLRCNRSGAPAAFEFAIGSVYYDSSMAEDFEPDSAVVLLDPRSGTERRRFKEESYLGISYSNHIKPTQAPERK